MNCQHESLCSSPDPPRKIIHQAESRLCHFIKWVIVVFKLKMASSSTEAVNSGQWNSPVANNKSEHLGDSLEVIWTLAACQVFGFWKQYVKQQLTVMHGTCLVIHSVNTSNILIFPTWRRGFFFSEQSIKTACSWLDETRLELSEGNLEHSADSSLWTRHGHPNTCRARNQRPQQPEHLLLFFKTFGHGILVPWLAIKLRAPGPPGKPKSTYLNWP